MNNKESSIYLLDSLCFQNDGICHTKSENIYKKIIDKFGMGGKIIVVDKLVYICND